MGYRYTERWTVWGNQDSNIHPHATLADTCFQYLLRSVLDLKKKVNMLTNVDMYIWKV